MGKCGVTRELGAHVKLPIAGGEEGQATREMKILYLVMMKLDPADLRN